MGMSGRGGGERGQTGGMGWEAERVEIDRGSGVGESWDMRSGVGGGESGVGGGESGVGGGESGVGGGESGDRLEWGGRGREWGRRGREWG